MDVCNNPMKVSVIIPNYNGEKYLRNCIASLQQQTYQDYELIFVDNASSDRSLEIMNEFAFSTPPLRMIRNTENKGFAKAVNQGIKTAAGEYIVLLNNDTEAQFDWLQYLVQAMEEDEKIFSVSSKMLRYHERDIIDDAGDEFTVLGWAYKRGDGRTSKYYTQKEEVFSSCAGAAIYRKSILGEIGLFEEVFFAYLEDVDLGYRARIHGYKNIYCPQAIIYHVGSATSGSKYNSFKIKISSRNTIYLIKKNMPHIAILINLPFLIIGFVIKGIFFSVKGYGMEYLSGLREGLVNCRQLEKSKMPLRFIKNYARIEWFLIVNFVKYVQQKLF